MTTPFSFFASASCAALLGATPVFVDIEPGTFNIDAGRIEDALTPKSKAVIPVHLFGQCADMDSILEIGARREIPVIEDACQAIGATHAGRGAGSMGAAGAFSFFPSKNLGAFGDGGLVTTNDDALASRLRMLRVHGERERYKHQEIGWNSRLDALQAAILRVKLPHLDRWSAGRVANADRYDRLFAEAGLVAQERVTLPVRAPYAGHIFNQYTIRVKRRDALGEHLKSRGIGWGIYYPIPLHLQECFARLGYEPGDFPEAERASQEVLSLPIFPELTPAADRARRLRDRLVFRIGDTPLFAPLFEDVPTTEQRIERVRRKLGGSALFAIHEAHDGDDGVSGVFRRVDGLKRRAGRRHHVIDDDHPAPRLQVAFDALPGSVVLRLLADDERPQRGPLGMAQRRHRADDRIGAQASDLRWHRPAIPFFRIDRRTSRAVSHAPSGRRVVFLESK